MAEIRTRETAGAASVPLPAGEVFTPGELSECWKLSENSIRRLFQDQAGVFKMGTGNPRGRRGYVTLRIPAAVALRVFQERSR